MPSAAPAPLEDDEETCATRQMLLSHVRPVLQVLLGKHAAPSVPATGPLDDAPALDAGDDVDCVMPLEDWPVPLDAVTVLVAGLLVAGVLVAADVAVVDVAPDVGAPDVDEDEDEEDVSGSPLEPLQPVSESQQPRETRTILRMVITPCAPCVPPSMAANAARPSRAQQPVVG